MRPSSGTSGGSDLPATKSTNSRRLRIECATRSLGSDGASGCGMISGSVILLSTFVFVLFLPDRIFVFHLRFQVAVAALELACLHRPMPHRRDKLSSYESRCRSSGLQPAHALQRLS